MNTDTQLSTSRIEAFSDGVIAIIITIMVFDLKITNALDATNFWDEALVLLPKFIAYLVSFIMIGILWVNHHQLFHQIQESKRGLLWYNLNLLFWMSLIPFATNLVGGNPLLPYAASIYSVVFLMNAMAFSFLRNHALRQQLLHQHINAGAHHRVLKKNQLAMALYALAAVLSFVSVYISYLLLLVVPSMYFVPQSIELKKSI